MNESQVQNILMPLVIVAVVVFCTVCGSSSEMLAMEVQHLPGRVKRCRFTLKLNRNYGNKLLFK